MTNPCGVVMGERRLGSLLGVSRSGEPAKLSTANQPPPVAWRCSPELDRNGTRNTTVHG